MIPQIPDANPATIPKYNEMLGILKDKFDSLASSVEQFPVEVKFGHYRCVLESKLDLTYLLEGLAATIRRYDREQTSGISGEDKT